MLKRRHKNTVPTDLPPVEFKCFEVSFRTKVFADWINYIHVIEARLVYQ